MATLPFLTALPDLDAKEEIKRQFELLWRERWGRMSLTVLALLLSNLFLPLWFVALCIIIDGGAELLAMHYMRALDKNRHPKRYGFVLACSFIMHFAFALPAAVIWQMDDAYAKAFAVGMIMSTLMQLIAARTIHLSFGYAGFSAVATTVVAGNAYYWVGAGNLHGFVVSSLAVAGGLSYTLIAMLSNNRLHRDAALDRKAAQASNKAKSRFLAQMSHELRTPLNAILGMGHAEQRRSKDALSQNRLAVLISAAEGLSTILDDILDMSAIEVGRLPIRPKRVQPQREIAATLALFQPGVAAAGLWLTQDIGAELDRDWMLDPQRLRQCMTNLLSNALKNTTQGGIHVAAHLVQRAADAPLLCVEIADTGPGIPDEMQLTLFDPLSSNRTQKARSESNGLGLSICRAMAQQMGGDLTIAPNRPGRNGARFILTLALALALDPSTDAAPQTPAPNPAPLPKTLGKTRITGLRVLVVDDIATNRLVASTYLRMLGATMIEAESGAQALDVLTHKNPDLILLDMNMPQMNGLETLANIRALPGWAGQTPVIAMTANALADHRELYLTSGVDGYLAKPINPGRIEAEINAVLDKIDRLRAS